MKQEMKKLGEKTIIVAEGTIGYGLLWVALGVAKFSKLCTKGGIALTVRSAERACKSSFISDDKRDHISKFCKEMNEAIAGLGK